jgi:hypothetical protein
VQRQASSVIENHPVIAHQSARTRPRAVVPPVWQPGSRENYPSEVRNFSTGSNIKTEKSHGRCSSCGHEASLHTANCSCVAIPQRIGLHVGRYM